MINPSKTKDFFGRFGVSYKDGNTIFAYDEITHGLYKLSLRYKEASLLLSPMEIHKYTSGRIQGISKINNEIILVPQSVGSKWILYNIEEKTFKYFLPFEVNTKISGVITIDRYLYLVPLNTNEPIIILSLDGFKIIKKYDDWYGKISDRTDEGNSIYGVSSFGDFVVFPIVGSNCIVYLNIENVNMITLDIRCQIHSASMHKDKFWILPVSGKYLYAVDFKGTIINRVNLNSIKAEILANDFARIVATEELIFLFPVNEGIVYAYQIKKNALIKMKTKEKPLVGSIFVKVGAAYWEYLIEDEILHLLPCNYPYKTIDIKTLRIKEYNLCYGNNINDSKYWKIAEQVHGGRIYKEWKRDLEEFIQFEGYFCGKHYMNEENKIGMQIWKNLQKSDFIG